MKSDKSFIPVLSTLCRRFWMSGLHVSRNLALLISLVINSSSLGTFLMAIKRARTARRTGLKQGTTVRSLPYEYLLITLSPMVFTILTSLPTARITQLKQPYCISMIILSMPLDHRSCLVFASLIFLPLSTPSTITS